MNLKRKLVEDPSVDATGRPERESTSSKYKFIKPPDPDEVRKFRDIKFLQHSNLFRWQTEELLSSLEVKQKTRLELNQWLNLLSSFIKEIPKSKYYWLKDEKWSEEGINAPLHGFRDLPKLNGNFCFIPPDDVRMIGSFPLGLATTHSPQIDVTLVLPKEFMQANDAFSGRWLFRRCLYLAWIGKALHGRKDLVTSVSWIQHCGSPLRPTLQIVPQGKLGKSWKINLFPVPAQDFKLKLISPTRNNVLPSCFYEKQEFSVASSSPTPHHNWLCGVDALMIHHNNFIASHLKHPSWINGVKLLKIWLYQRGFNQGGGISSHFMVMLVIHLSKLHKISPQSSPYQVFRTALLYISQSDWRTDGITLFDDKHSPRDRNVIVPSTRDLHELYPLVFVDATGFFNLAGNAIISTYLELQHEAKLGLKILELSSTSSFDALFIQRREFHLCFDQLASVKFTKVDLASILKRRFEDSETIAVDRLGDVRMPVFNLVISTLAEGLGDRVDLIAVKRERIAPWDYDSSPPTIQTTLTIGFLLREATYSGLLTKGPSADSSESAKFRKFWGEISSLRRFRDSTFHEAVLWMDPTDPVGERRAIASKIVAHVMNSHFQVTETKLHFIGGEFEEVLRLAIQYYRDETFKYGTGEELLNQSILAFDSLSRKLRSLDLPLNVSQIQSSSDVLKHCAVFPPVPFALPSSSSVPEEDQASQLYVKFSSEAPSCPQFIQSIEVQIFFEISGKWPDDLSAIKAIKTEFLCKIASLLTAEGVTAVPFPSHLFIIWEGYVFKLKICYRREIYMLRLHTDDAEELDTEASVQLEKEIEILPKLTSSLNSLQSEFPNFSGGVRLVRRWVSSQLFFPHLPSVVVDLLVAHLYLTSFPHQPPARPHVVLLRFISLMAHTDWNSTQILVNLGGHFNEIDESELMSRFSTNRSSWPNLFVCSPCELRTLTTTTDPTPEDLDRRYKLASCWSKDNPTPPMLARIKEISRVALEVYTKNIWNQSFDFKLMFRPPLNDFDAVIFLNEKEVSRRMERIESTKRRHVTLPPYKRVKGEKLPPVDFDPVQIYLKLLRVSFGNHALFFNDEHGGSVIGIIWKPSAFEEREAKMSCLEGHKLVGIKEVKQVLNADALVEEFRILGLGLVKDIKLKS